MALIGRGVLMVIGAFFVHLTLGTIYTFGNMSIYFASYFKSNGMHVSTADMTWVYAAMLACQGLLMSVGGILEQRIGPRITAMLGSAFMSAGVTLTYFTIKKSFLLVILTYGIMYGIGISFAYISLISTGMKWFPHHRGVVNGVIVGGFGLGAFIFNQVQTAFLNPENYLPDKNGYFTEPKVTERVPYVFLLLGGTYALTQLFGCLLVTSAPVNNKQEIKPLVKKVSMPSINKSTAIHIVDTDDMCSDLEPSSIMRSTEQCFKLVDYTPMQMLHTREFYLLFWIMFFITQTANFTNAMYKAFGQTFIKDDHFLTLVGAISAIFNASGRTLWGLMIDKYSFKLSIRVLGVLSIIFLVTMPSTVSGGPFMFAVWICALYIIVSGVFVLIPTCVATQFGTKYVGINYGLVFSNMFLGGPLTAILTQTLCTIMGYDGMFYLLALFASISFFLTVFFREANRETRNQTMS